VNFCLADAVPDRIKRRRGIEGVDDPLKTAEHFDPDPSVGSRILARPGIGEIVESSLLHFQGERYALSAWCVMPNHVHAVVTPYSDFALSQVLHSWKSYSAHQINKKLNSKGTIWEKESFDHLVRNERAFATFVEYTENNPVAAGLCETSEHWQFCSARHRDSAE
jgi:REP element-mobilizing transposase RayT